MNWSERCANIKAVITDIDGVLTDGSVGYGCGSNDEIKFFNIKDGTGFRLAKYAGLKIASISGRRSKANERRLSELDFDVIMQGCLTKAQGLLQVCELLGIKPENCMYLGDDLIDVPVFDMVGLAVAVNDADPYTKGRADWVTELPGGHGAAREAIDRLLQLQGTYESTLESYFNRKKASQKLGQ